MDEENDSGKRENDRGRFSSPAKSCREEMAGRSDDQLRNRAGACTHYGTTNTRQEEMMDFYLPEIFC